MGAGARITFVHQGDFRDTISFFKRSKEKMKIGDLDNFGRMGVEALRRATPKDTGKTAESWSYEIIREKDRTILAWNNSNIVNYVPIAVIIQYGHATRNGGYVEGVDYINPAIQPIFDQIENNAWKEITWR